MAVIVVQKKGKGFLIYAFFIFWFSTGQCFLNILDKSTVEEGEMFTMTCDYLRFDDYPHVIDDIGTLLLSCKLPGDKEFNTLYKLSPISDYDKKVSKIPPGRQWAVLGRMGDYGYEGKKEDINLTITVYDATVDDSGSYMCFFRYHKLDGFTERKERNENLTVIKKISNKTTATRMTTTSTPKPTSWTMPPINAEDYQYNILDKSTVEEGESFTMTCDYRRLREVPSPVLHITYLQLSRSLGGAGAMSLIYCYNPMFSFVTPERKSGIPPGRLWDVKTDRGHIHDYRALKEVVNLTVTVKDTAMADSGIYECCIRYSSFPVDPYKCMNETLTVVKKHSNKSTKETTTESNGTSTTTTGERTRPQFTAVRKVTHKKSPLNVFKNKSQAAVLRDKEYTLGRLLLLVITEILAIRICVKRQK